MEHDRGRGTVGIWPICVDPSLGEHLPASARPYCSELTNDWAQFLCVIPVPVVRWVLVGIAFLLSGAFLVMNIYPILASVSHNPF